MTALAVIAFISLHIGGVNWNEALLSLSQIAQTRNANPCTPWHKEFYCVLANQYCYSIKSIIGYQGLALNDAV